MNHPDADKNFFALIAPYLHHDPYAMGFCQILNGICHVWDDLIDKDKPVSDSDINTAFRVLLFDLPRNPFYQLHASVLQPLILSTSLQYQTANKLERGNSHAGKLAAYSLRNDMLNIYGMAIYLVGGQESYDQFAADYYTKCAEGLLREYPIFAKEFSI